MFLGELLQAEETLPLPAADPPGNCGDCSLATPAGQVLGVSPTEASSVDTLSTVTQLRVSPSACSETGCTVVGGEGSNRCTTVLGGHMGAGEGVLRKHYTYPQHNHIDTVHT